MSTLKKDNNTLLAGKTGQCLFLLSKNDNGKAFLVMEEVLNSLDKDPVSGAFGIGLAGILSTLNLMVDRDLLDYEDIDPVVENTNSFLSKQCDLYIQQGCTEFLFGASGILWYYLSDKRTPADIINRHLAHLLNDENTNPKLGFEPNRHFPHINIGLAHGITGTGMVLLKALADRRVIHRSKIRETLANVERYILGYLDMDNEESIFPIKVFKDSGELMHSDSLSWSYGDLGTILFLMELALYEQNEDKQDRYRQLLHHALTYVESSYEASEDNLGLRHGLGGQIMVLNRLAELLPHDQLLQKVKNRQTEVFSTLVKQRALTEWVFERDLGAKTLLNDLTNDAGLNLGRLFAL